MTPVFTCRHDAGGEPRPEVQCDLCGEMMPEPRDADGEPVEFFVCDLCIEDVLNASTDHPRAEVGLVGSRGGRS